MIFNFKGDLKRALEIAAALSMAVYRSGGEGDASWAKHVGGRLPDGIRLTSVFDKFGTQALLCESDTDLWVVFRGTEVSCLMDIKTDVVGSLVPVDPQVPDATYHFGFLKAWLAVRREILDAAAKSGKPVTITGHSLGGALSYIAAHDLRLHGRFVRRVITFGAPKVCNKVFRVMFNQELGDKTFRVVYEGDKVPRIVVQSLLRMQHLGGKVLFLQDDNRLLLNPPSLYLLVRRIVNATEVCRHIITGKWRLISEGMRKHSMRNYRNLLDRCSVRF